MFGLADTLRRGQGGDAAGARVPHDAAALAASLPRLVLEARRVASTIIHGLHGRRRAGTGENFWQFRRFTDGEPANRVDWRRSARDQHLYVREQEWEAAHTVWIWPDRSASMRFASDLARVSKHDRALVIAFALAEILVRGGERVGIPGLMRPTASRAVIERMADAILADAAGKAASLPPRTPVSRLSEAVILSDCLVRPETFGETVKNLAASGSRGHVLMINDPVEETFPYRGRVEFEELEEGLTITAGRAETWRDDYVARLADHRAALRRECETRGWSFGLHRTDQAPAGALLALHQRMGSGPLDLAAAAPARGTARR
ncbi:hypothetical protein BN1110_04527 [bacterium YEK0313]|nr:hypothetical protein BN1110_04527 [bacterium YEK0313]